MGFILYTPAKVRGGDRPAITLGQKTGTFNINSAAMELLGLSDSARVNVYVDPDTLDLAIAVTPRGTLTIRKAKEPKDGAPIRGQLSATGLIDRFKIPRGQAWNLSRDIEGDAYVVGKLASSRPSGLPDGFRR